MKFLNALKFETLTYNKMSEEQSTTTQGYQPTTRNFEITTQVEPTLKNKIQNQELRKGMQDKMIDLGNLQTKWDIQESELRGKSEDYISQLRDLAQRNEIAKNDERAKHLQVINQINEEHQKTVLDLQAQIDQSIAEDAEMDVGTEIDEQIENLKLQIAEYQKIDQMKTEEDEQLDQDKESVEDENETRLTQLQDELTEKQSLYESKIQERESNSKAVTKQLEELIQTQQKDDIQKRQRLQQLVSELNNLDKEQRSKISSKNRQLKDSKAHLTSSLRTINTKTVALQQDITRYQNNQKKKMKAILAEEEKVKMELESVNAKHRGYLDESMTAARKCSEEKRKFVQMQHEIEELHAELMRETIEHENLIKEANRLDDDILDEMGNFSQIPSLSFSYNRF